MKRLWWITIVVFFLGVGAGNGIARFGGGESDALPSFTTEPIASQTATQPEAEQVGAIKPQEGFPFALEYTSLVAQKLIAYEGAYLEGGTEENVVDIAALVLENTGTIGIEYAQIVLVQDGKELVFNATYIPPKSTILLLERNQYLYSSAPVTACRCRTVIPGVFDQAQRTVEVKEVGMSTLEVTNLTDQQLDCVQIFYKRHEGENDLYVGGITYSAVTPELQPGQTYTISLYRYASGYTKVVAVIPK